VFLKTSQEIQINVTIWTKKNNHHLISQYRMVCCFQLIVARAAERDALALDLGPFIWQRAVPYFF
jgi:hypothetical protein